jgi:RND family efflux transporter MFP subunit
VLGGAGFFLIAGTFRNGRTDLITHTIRREKLELTIVERGALESAKNAEITCTVKSGTKGSSFSTTIKSIIDDGSHVKAGDLLVELDDSGLLDQEKAQVIAVDQARLAKVQAEENLKIVLKQNESDIKTAEVAVQLARIDLVKYQDADYKQALSDIEGRLEQLRDRAAWSERMVKKGYLGKSQAEADRLALVKVQEERRVLDYTKDRTETDLKSKLMEAERALERVKAQADAKEKQARAEAQTKAKILKQEEERLEDIRKEIKKCRIVAPQDGMVVYFVNEYSRYGASSRSSVIAQGEPVSEGQKLMRIPDLRTMQVNVKVHEALVSRVRVGQPALVRVDAFPTRVLRGQVRQVATVASQADWYSSDVKVYQTLVAIDDTLEGIKPGMSAEVTIEVAKALDDVVTIPVQAIIGGTDLGKHRKCLVMTSQRLEERNITIGMSNERMAEVKEGLAEGETVVLNPRAIIGDKLKTRLPAAERSRPAADEAPPGPPPAERPPAEKASKPGKSKGEAKKGPASGPAQ